jgi:hypothetical protein
LSSKTIVLLSLSSILVACGPKGGAGGGGGEDTKAAATDLSKPYLTDKKVEGVISLLQEKPEYWKDLKPWTPLTANAELEALIKKHGFSSYQDFAASFSRVSTGLAAAAMEKSVKETDAARSKALSDPNLTPEMKKMLEDSTKATSPFSREFPELNEADRKVIEKYYDQLLKLDK